MATNVEGWGGQEGKITYTHHHDEHMGAMGHHLGFRPLGAALWLEVDLAQLGGARGRREAAPPISAHPSRGS